MLRRGRVLRLIEIGIGWGVSWCAACRGVNENDEHPVHPRTAMDFARDSQSRALKETLEQWGGLQYHHLVSGWW